MAMAASGPKWALHDILRRVQCGDIVTENKTYILLLLGRERDRKEAWQELLDLYEGIGGVRGELFGLDSRDAITLSRRNFVSVETDWAGES